MEKARYLYPNDYMADPSVHVFNEKLYIYPSHDWDSNVVENDNGDHFNMKDYHAFSMDDINGPIKNHGKILDLKDIPWASKQLWDSDVAFKDNIYYLYFSAKDRDGIFRIGIATSKDPVGPFIPSQDPVPGSFSIDPCLFEDDNNFYMYFGGLWGGQLEKYRNNIYDNNNELPGNSSPALGPKIAKMRDDMSGYAESPKDILIIDQNGESITQGDTDRRFFEASWMHKYKNQYYFSYSTGDTHKICYATGDNPYGPFVFQGTILTPVIGWTTHHSIIEFKNKWYLFHHDCLPSNGITWLRSMKVIELEYNYDGNIKTIQGSR
jgi:hypothetical protein